MPAPAPEASVMWTHLAELAATRERPLELRARFQSDRDGQTPVTIILEGTRPRAKLSAAAKALFATINADTVAKNTGDAVEAERWRRSFDAARDKGSLGLNECCRLLLGPAYRPERSVHAYNANDELLVDAASAAPWFDNLDRGSKWLSLSELMAPFRSESPTGAGTTGADGDDEDPDEDLRLEPVLLDPILADDLRTLSTALVASGELLPESDLAPWYRNFRDRFGPQVLRGLDGERLLLTMHERGRERRSLVYWLEFKDDAEFPASFGSIAGGSALKFGFYQRAETKDWWGGTGTAQVRLSLDEAIARARVQRDQLLAGADVLDAAARAGAEVDYVELQRQMVRAAPDLAETAWGHKYFAVLFPTVLDDFHALEYQRFQIVKLLKAPTGGRYSNAYFFAGAARQLGLGLSNLGSLLNRRNGSPHKYWRIGTTSGGVSDWARMRDGSFVGIGWAELGDLSGSQGTQESKDAIRERFENIWPGDAGAITRQSKEIFDFATRAAERDVVVAMDGATIRGIGVITGPYLYQPGDGPFAHRRAVRWISFREGRLPRLEQPRTTFRPLGKSVENLIEIERRIFEARSAPSVVTPKAGPSTPPPSAKAPVAPPPPPLDGTDLRIHSALQRKRQVILYGPPGTGKTYCAEHAIWELAARSWVGCGASALTAAQAESLRTAWAVVTCTFHASYGYEDFVEGFRPEHLDGHLTFQRKDGIFKRLCAAAAKKLDLPFFLLIDEINRGDVPRIFGELLTVLEKDKRDKPVLLPISGETFAVPDNVFVVGTMNTADRSIALLDAALRRRFAFVELMPDVERLADVMVRDLPLGPWLEELNKRIRASAGRDARHLQIGHAYLMAGGLPLRDTARFVEVLRHDIIPLLEEYCYESYESLAKILGDRIVQRENQRIDERLFEPANQDLLFDALLKAFDVIATAPSAVAADVARKGEPDEDDEPAEDVAEATA